MDRRAFIQAAGASALLAVSEGPSRAVARAVPPGPSPSSSVDALLADTQQRTFNYFWQTTDPKRGLAPDFTPDRSPASIAAMGFALTAVPIGIEHGWISRAAGVERVLSTLKFLRDAPQGVGMRDCSGYKGFFYHFLDFDTGTRHANSELSTIDTALLLMGVRCCGQYFGGPEADESAIRSLADTLCERVEWPWMQKRGAAIAMGWMPETGILPADWIGYSEGIPVYLLALGSTAHPVGEEAWSAWTSGYAKSWGTIQGIEHLTFGALCMHQYPQVWLDLHGPSDAYMRARGIDYFENSRRAVLSQRAYAIANPLGWQGYGASIWGLSACDGPVNRQLPYRGSLRTFHTYAARGVCLDPAQNYDDGTLTPTAVLGSLPFAPELIEPAVAAMYKSYGSAIYGEYGFLDCFNPSFQYDVELRSGRRVGELGWADTRYYGIDQGPIIAMIENHRSGLIWRVMRQDPVMRRGLERAGFRGGWLP